MIMLHTTAAILAILSGLVILPLRKGTTAHRMIGRVYMFSIVSMCVLSFFIREINNGGFSIFHLITIQTLVFAAAGLVFLFLCSSVEYWYVLSLIHI